MRKKKQPTTLVTKEEALELLSKQMRKANLASNVFARLANTYAKLAGWKPTSQDEPKEASLDQQVLAAEKKRKQQAITPSQENTNV
jgi:hypothetical protein